MTAVRWLSAAVLLAVVPAAYGAQVDDIVRQVQKRYDATSDFTARVHQELVVASSGQTLTADGEVAFKRPGKLNWKLEGADAQLIVADGTFLWLYQPEEQQVLKAPYQSAFRSTTPISFLTGVGRIADDFDVTLAGRSEHEVDLDLQPRHGEADFGRLRLIVDASTSDIVGAEVRDPVGNVTKLRFTELRRNVDIPDSRFTFTVPSGVDVIQVPIGY